MPRKVFVSTVSMWRSDVPRKVEANLSLAERLLEQAAAPQPDIVCLPEMFSLVSVKYQEAAEVAEPLPGPTTDRIGAVARRHRMYVICPLLIQEGNSLFNAAVLLDRQGQIAGVYRKVHPTVGELKTGVVPGQGVEVFQTDFGAISILICMDIEYPERWREAKILGAEALFWPSMYEGGLPLQCLARANKYYVVSSTWGWHSQVLDITGYPLVSTGQLSQTVSAQIDLEKRLFPTTDHMAKCQAILAKYGAEWQSRCSLQKFASLSSLTIPL